MQITIRHIGNSKGCCTSQTAFGTGWVGLDDQSTANMTVQNGAIVLRKPAQSLRAGWAEAARALAVEGGDELLMVEFVNL